MQVQLLEGKHSASAMSSLAFFSFFFLSLFFWSAPFKFPGCVPLCPEKRGFRTRQNTSKNTEVAYLVWIMAGETAAAVLSKKNGPVAGKETAALSHSA